MTQVVAHAGEFGNPRKGVTRMRMAHPVWVGAAEYPREKPTGRPAGCLPISRKIGALRAIDARR